MAKRMGMAVERMVEIITIATKWQPNAPKTTRKPAVRKQWSR